MMWPFLAGFAVAAVMSIPFYGWWLAVLKMDNARLEEQVDAWRRADRQADLDTGLSVDGVVVLPSVSAPADRLPPSAAIVPSRKPAKPYDQDQVTATCGYCTGPLAEGDDPGFCSRCVAEFHADEEWRGRAEARLRKAQRRGDL